MRYIFGLPNLEILSYKDETLIALLLQLTGRWKMNTGVWG